MVAAAIPVEVKCEARGGSYPRTRPRGLSIEEQSKTQWAGRKRCKKMHAPSSACSPPPRASTAEPNPQMTNLPLHTTIDGGNQRLCFGRAVELEQSHISMETRGSLEHQGWDVGRGRP